MRSGIQHQGLGKVHELDRITTSFFSNFLDETKRSELWKIFVVYGRVGEVYILKKWTNGVGNLAM